MNAKKGPGCFSANIRRMTFKHTYTREAAQIEMVEKQPVPFLSVQVKTTIIIGTGKNNS
jgi:hypothetical protein